jgi:hypothetical protein
MVWKSCGYISLTKDEKKLKIVVKKENFIADLNDVKAVLNGWLDYTEIFEPPETKQ